MTPVCKPIQQTNPAFRLTIFHLSCEETRGMRIAGDGHCRREDIPRAAKVRPGLRIQWLCYPLYCRRQSLQHGFYTTSCPVISLTPTTARQAMFQAWACETMGPQ